MLDEEVARVVAQFQEQVLDALTRLINQAFDHALAEHIREVAFVPTKRASTRHRRARKTEQRETEAARVVASAPATTPLTGAKRRSKGPSRNEIDRLVEAGLPGRLGSEATPQAPLDAS